MDTKLSPVTPGVLEWCIGQDGRTDVDVARALKVPPATLRAWVAGEEQPSVGQVSDLARVLKRPRALFFLPEAPTSAGMPDGFRHPPGAESRTVSNSVLLQARRAKRLQQAMAAITPTDESPRVPRATLNSNPEALANEVRQWLETDRNQRWESDTHAMKGWRAALSDVGILVFTLQLGADEVRGFAYWDDRAPMIVTNVSSVSPAARTFTMAHELGHLLLREATACIEPKRLLTIDTTTERWCEAFAAALLMPTPAVDSLMRSLHVGEGEATIELGVRQVMRTFRISGRAAALRLSDLGYAAPGLYGQVEALFRPGPAKKGGGGRDPRHVKRVREYGVGVVRSVMVSLPTRDALLALRMTVEDARRLADEVPGVPVL